MERWAGGWVFVPRSRGAPAATAPPPTPGQAPAPAGPAAAAPPPADFTLLDIRSTVLPLKLTWCVCCSCEAGCLPARAQGEGALRISLPLLPPPPPQGAGCSLPCGHLPAQGVPAHEGRQVGACISSRCHASSPSCNRHADACRCPASPPSPAPLQVHRQSRPLAARPPRRVGRLLPGDEAGCRWQGLGRAAQGPSSGGLPAGHCISNTEPKPRAVRRRTRCFTGG